MPVIRLMSSHLFLELNNSKYLGDRKHNVHPDEDPLDHLGKLPNKLFGLMVCRGRKVQFIE